MKNIIDTILRISLELKRLYNGGELKPRDWIELYRLRGELL